MAPGGNADAQHFQQGCWRDPVGRATLFQNPGSDLPCGLGLFDFWELGLRVFVATAAGKEDGDYSHTIEGEMVRLPVTCDVPDCECSRAMTGMASGQSTTTFTIKDLDVDRDIYTELLWSTLERDSWVTEGNADDLEWVDKLVGLHLDLAETFEVGVPLRLAGDRLYERRS